MDDAGFQTNTIRTVRLLQTAASQHVVALLELRGDAERAPFDAEIIALTDAGLRMRPRTACPNAIIGVNCDAQVQINDVAYVFESHIVGIETEAGQPVLALSIPDQLTVLERRLKPRVRLARSADVHLRWGSTMEPQNAVAKLLNLSTTGIACQLDAALAAGVLIGDAADIALPLGDDEDWVHLPATVRNKMESSSPTAVIVGMEFNQEEIPAELIVRLRQHVNETTDARVS